MGQQLYDPKTKWQSSHWKSPSSLQPKNACQVQHCWLFSLIVKVLWILNTHCKARLLTNISSYKCWNVINSLESGNPVSGRLTMTMNMPSEPSLCSGVLLNTVFHEWHSLPPCLLDVASCDFFFHFLKLKNFERQQIWLCGKNWTQCNGACVGDSKN